MTNAELTALRKALPHGSQKKIAVLLNISTAAVCQVLKGKTNNDSVIDAAINILKIVKNRQVKQSKKISQLL